MSSNSPKKQFPFSLTERIISRQFQQKDKEKRKEVLESGNSCLTCSHTKSQMGIYLHCSKKDKLVKQYNYCELHKEMEGKQND